jgi:hypothetical protein
MAHYGFGSRLAIESNGAVTIFIESGVSLALFADDTHARNEFQPSFHCKISLRAVTPDQILSAIPTMSHLDLGPIQQ